MLFAQLNGRSLITIMKMVRTVFKREEPVAQSTDSSHLRLCLTFIRSKAHDFETMPAMPLFTSTLISTRRFFGRPSGVVLSAVGLADP